MSEKIILLFEFISTILFSLEYFLYKKQIDLIGKDFSKQLREFRKSQKKDFKQANLKIKNSSKLRNILKALLSVILIVISVILLLKINKRPIEYRNPRGLNFNSLVSAFLCLDQPIVISIIPIMFINGCSNEVNLNAASFINPKELEPNGETKYKTKPISN